MLLSFWLRLAKMFQRKEALFLLVMCAVGQRRATLTCYAADVHSIEETPFLCSARSKFLARQTSSHPSHPLGRVSIYRQLTRSRHFAATRVLLKGVARVPARGDSRSPPRVSFLPTTPWSLADSSTWLTASQALPPIQP